jgi:hypothetical protein
VRVIEYDIANRDSDSGTPIRLLTTILDIEQASASELAAVYHQRWEFGSSLAEIETRQRGSYRVLRSHSPEMVRQEIWALLLTHYAIRALIYQATDAEHLDPLRMSFIRTLRIVRRHVTGHAGFSPESIATCTRHAIAEILQRPTRPDATAATRASPNEPVAPNSAKNPRPQQHQLPRTTRNPTQPPPKLSCPGGLS